jgi:hypothetical protein
MYAEFSPLPVQVSAIYQLSFVIRMFLIFVTLDNSFSEFQQTKQVISRNIFIFFGGIHQVSVGGQGHR